MKREPTKKEWLFMELLKSNRFIVMLIMGAVIVLLLILLLKARFG